MTAITALTRLCPPPAGDLSAIDWDAVERTLGMQLPEDYKQLATGYGPGSFCDFLSIYHPHGVTEWVDLTGPMPAKIGEQLRQDYTQGTHPVPYNPEHLFTIGVTGNGDYVFWITDPATAPDTWHIAVSESRGPLWFTFEGTLTEFLVAVLSAQTRVPMFPKDLLDPGVFFTPSRRDLEYTPQPPTRGPVDTKIVRAWARANGYQVEDHGRIPAEILQAWERANPI